MTFEPGLILRAVAEIIGWLLIAYSFLLGVRVLLKSLLSAGKSAWRETQVL
jgi:hypothetical protein